MNASHSFSGGIRNAIARYQNESFLEVDTVHFVGNGEMILRFLAHLIAVVFEDFLDSLNDQPFVMLTSILELH